MANRANRVLSAPSAANVATSPDITNVDTHFELKPALIMMVQTSPFNGKAHEDANMHIQYFLEIYSTFTIKGVTQEAIRLCLFPFSLLGKAKQWFYSNHNVVDT